MSILDPESLIKTGGLALIAFIVFAESGLLFGFFFPGDTLLFIAGALAAQGQFPIALAIAVVVISSIAGNSVGYYIGERAGPRMFRKEDGIFFRKEYIDKSEKFYEKHGGKTIVLARFIPIVRTFAPVVAGIGHMDKRLFLIYNITGGLLWGAGVTLLGYFFGQLIPNIEAYILPIVGIVALASFGPGLYHVFRNPESRALLKQKIFTRFKG